MSSKDLSAIGDVNPKVQDLLSKIAIEKKVYEGALAMLSKLKNEAARQQCEISVMESKGRIDFLEAELTKRKSSSNRSINSPASSPSSFSPLSPKSGLVSSNSADNMAPWANHTPHWGQRKSSLQLPDLTKQNIPLNASHQPRNSNSSRTNSNSNLFGSLMHSLGKSYIPGNSVTASASTTPGGSNTSMASNLEAQSSLEESHTALGYLKFGTALSSEKVAFRLKHIQEKLDIEQKVRTGTENLILAMSKNNSSVADPSHQKIKTELETKLAEANAKVSYLLKSEQQFAALKVSDENESPGDLDDIGFTDIGLKRTGRLKVKIIGGVNIPGKRSSKDEYYAVIIVDGYIKATSKAAKNRIDESFEIQVDKAKQIEIAIYDRPSQSAGTSVRSPLLAFVWFNIADLQDDLLAKLGPNYAEKGLNSADMHDIWFDMEPGGQVAVRLNFVQVSRTKTTRDQMVRRQNVQKVYPRNEHKFAAIQSYQVMQCAVCNEFMSGKGYQCLNCQYGCHTRCYQRVITKCISMDEYTNLKKEGGDTNTGQLLKYNIPHRIENVTNLSANWCYHCGYILPVAKKIAKCTECSKTAHKNCAVLLPNFCGLHPQVADKLVAAFEEAAAKAHQKDLEEAEVEAAKRKETLASEPLLNTTERPFQIDSSAVSMDDITDTMNNISIPTQSLTPFIADENVAVTAPVDYFDLINNFSNQPPQPAQQPSYQEQQNQSYQQQYQQQQQQLQLQLHTKQISEEEYLNSQQLLLQQQQGQLHQQLPHTIENQYIPPRQQMNLNIIQQPQHVVSVSQPSIHASGSQKLEHYEFQPAPTPSNQQPSKLQVDLYPLVSPVVDDDKLQLSQQISPAKSLAKRLSATFSMPAKYEKITLDDFSLIAVLGRGAFGKVMLASDKKTKDLYAIKALKKEFIIQNDDVKSTKLEKRIFQAASAARHPFLVNLHSAFQSPSRIYFVMEYVNGGDLFCHIHASKRFPHERAKFYACEVLLALEYFHKNHIIYRDLKLDNILLCSDGHIKVADYGICKDNVGYGSTTRTFCGTPDYMAPEILLSRSYGRAVDWWSFGVLIYVMLVGKYPFHGDDEVQILEEINSNPPDYPRYLERESVSILKQLMVYNPTKRLGGGKGDAEEVKNHVYFNLVDWTAMLKRKVIPPWKPSIGHATDVSNFDKEFTSENAVLTPVNSILSQVDQNEFKDFDYISEWAQQQRRLL